MTCSRVSWFAAALMLIGAANTASADNSTSKPACVAGSQPAMDDWGPLMGPGERPPGWHGQGERGRGKRSGTQRDVLQPPDGPGAEDGPAVGPEGDRPPRRGDGMGRGPKGPPGPDDDGAMLKPEEIEPFLEFTKQHFPQVHEQLVRAKEHDQRAFYHMLRRLGPPMVHLMRMSQNNPQEAERFIRMQKLELQIREQWRAYQSADAEPARAAVRAELAKLLEQRFELRQEHLKAEIDDLRRRLDEQGTHKQQIIEAELKRMFEAPRDRGPWQRPEDAPASRPAHE